MLLKAARRVVNAPQRAVSWSSLLKCLESIVGWYVHSFFVLRSSGRRSIDGSEVGTITMPLALRKCSGRFRPSSRAHRFGGGI
jgi:hypothetical protein